MLGVSPNSHPLAAALPMAALAVAAVLLVVSVEAALVGGVRLPGHRALPGALAVLVLAEVLPTVALGAVALAVPAALAILGLQPPGLVLAWAVTVALLLSAARRAPGARRSPWLFLAIGLIYGLLRLAVLPGGHHTPLAVRLGGHLAFGGLGGLLAFGAVRLGTRGRGGRASGPDR